MDEEVYNLLLNGMPFKHFIVYYVIGVAGGLVFFLGNVYNSIKTDTTTPNHWSWRAFIKGGIRVFLMLITLAFGIVYFPEISPILFNVTDFEMDVAMVDINSKSAFLMGIGIDRLWKALLSVSESGAKAVLKKR